MKSFININIDINNKFSFNAFKSNHLIIIDLIII
jgi:hypothetical protein